MCVIQEETGTLSVFVSGHMHKYKPLAISNKNVCFIKWFHRKSVTGQQKRLKHIATTLAT